MEIEKIDKNFARAEIGENGQRYRSVTEDPFCVYGVFWSEKEGCFLRMPAEAAARVSPEVAMLNRCTAGGRVRFRTDARRLYLRAALGSYGKFPHMPISGTRGFVVCEIRDGKELWMGSLMPQWNEEAGFESAANLTGGMREYILYMPLYEEVHGLWLGFEEGVRVERGSGYDSAPILYYGSSITQGGCACRPDTCYQAIIAKRTGLDYVNLGFSGSGKGEPAMAEYLGTVACSAFVCDYDHNSPTAETFEQTHYALYETFRRAQPETPVLFVGRPTPEYDPEHAARRRVIRRTYERALASGDRNVGLLDGARLFGRKERDLCTVDGVHPTDLGFYRMADKIGACLAQLMKK